MTDIQTRLVSRRILGRAIALGRRRRAGGAFVLALLVPALAAAQGPTPAPPPVGSQLIGLLP